MTELETLRAEITELRYEHGVTRSLLSEAIMRLKDALDALIADPGSPHAGAEAARAVLAGETT